MVPVRRIRFFNPKLSASSFYITFTDRTVPFLKFSKGRSSQPCFGISIKTRIKVQETQINHTSPTLDLEGHHFFITHPSQLTYFHKMGFFHLFIVNKSGGLIHHRPLGPRAPHIGTNEWLRIGSTFHSLHAIAAEASPKRLSGNKVSCK